MFGAKNWKGRMGAVGTILGGVALCATGLACAVGIIGGGGDGVEPKTPTECWGMIVAGATAVSLGFSQFGIREAIGPSKAPKV